ncbi:MAG: ATP-binding protein [Ferruginibacter sp.]
MHISRSSNASRLPEETPYENKHNEVFLKELEEQVQIRTAALVAAHKLELENLKLEKNLRADELNVANIERLFENDEKEKRAAELLIANVELKYQNIEKEKRAAELSVANLELVFQSNEKQNRASELNIANIELLFQNGEREKRAAELKIANIELVFQNSEKEKRAAELVIANLELVYQNGEKVKRSAELKIANIELIFQNGEKEKRAEELVIANVELSFQNEEKEKRASELNLSKIANIALVFQISENEKQASELISANKELAAFNYISSHDLQEPIRKIQYFTDFINKTELGNLSPKGIDAFNRIQSSANQMEKLIYDLLEYSKTSSSNRLFEKVNLSTILDEVTWELSETILEKKATIEAKDLGDVYINASQFRQVLTNLLTNALKFSKPGIPPHIILTGKQAKADQCIQENTDLKNGCLAADKSYYHLRVSDNGIGYEPKFSKKIFDIFQRLHGQDKYKGTGIGLAIVKKIVENHSGKITSDSKPGIGTNFNIYLPSFFAPKLLS